VKLNKGGHMFCTLPNGQMVNKNQVIKIDTDSSGTTRLVMTGGIIVSLKNTSIKEVLDMLGESHEQ